MVPIPLLAAFLEIKVGTLRKRVERGVCPIRIRQIECDGASGEQYAIVSDIYRFLLDGEPQPQPPLLRRAARNPYGKKGKVGRKTNAQKASEAATKGGSK